MVIGKALLLLRGFINQQISFLQAPICHRKRSRPCRDLECKHEPFNELWAPRLNSAVIWHRSGVTLPVPPSMLVLWGGPLERKLAY